MLYASLFLRCHLPVGLTRAVAQQCCFWSGRNASGR